jgi:hypothetical protein
MTHDTVQFARRSLERFLSGQPDWDELDPDLEIRDHDIPERGEYRGHDGFSRLAPGMGQRVGGAVGSARAVHRRRQPRRRHRSPEGKGT